MAQIRLTPSTYYLSNSSYLSVSNASNMYDNTDSTNYATVTNSRTSTSSYYIYVRGFNFDDIPAGAIINDFTVKIKCNYSGGYSQAMYLYDGTSTSYGSSDSISSTVTTHTFTCSHTWDDVVACGSDFGIRINCRRSSRNTTSYIYIYGAEILVDYTMPVSATVTSSLQGAGTIEPSGATQTYEGNEYELVITPTDKSATVTATKNGADITSQLVAHGAGSTTSATPADVTTSGVQSGSQYAEYCIGYSAEEPSSSGTSSNMYASSDSTGYAAYTFDFSGIPSTATIEEITVRCYGHRESSTIDSSHVSQCALYVSGTLVSNEVDFPTTSNTLITVEPTQSITRSDLDNIALRHYVGYYGGLVLGITFEVTYATGTGLDHYTYTYTVDGDAVIVVTIGGSAETDKLYVKNGSTWQEVAKAYKKVGGAWVEQDITQVFDSTKKYIRG